MTSDPLTTPPGSLVQGNESVAPTVGDVWCVVVAGGSGRRYGAMKQFEDLRGARVIDRSVRTAAVVCDGVVVVVPAAEVAAARSSISGVHAVVEGGATRAGSVRAGLLAVPATASVVLVHDAARPLATAELFQRVIAAVRDGADAVVPAIPVVDTIRSVEGGVVDREQLRAVQTPQGFDAALLRRVHASGPEATDDAGLVEADGGSVTLVDGERSNLKLTERADRLVAEALLDAAVAGLVGAGYESEIAGPYRAGGDS